MAILILKMYFFGLNFCSEIFTIYVYASWIDPFENSTSTQTKGNANSSFGGGGYMGGTLY